MICFQGTISIDYFIDGFSTSGQQFNGFVHEKDLKKSTIATHPILGQIDFIIQKGDKEFPGHLRIPQPFCRLGNKIKINTFWTFKAPVVTTIAKFKQFSKAPSPLNRIVWSKY